MLKKSISQTGKITYPPNRLGERIKTKNDFSTMTQIKFWMELETIKADQFRKWLPAIKLTISWMKKLSLSYHPHSWQKWLQVHFQLLKGDKFVYEESVLWPVLYHQGGRTYTFQLCPSQLPGHLLFWLFLWKVPLKKLFLHQELLLCKTLGLCSSPKG